MVGPSTNDLLSLRLSETGWFYDTDSEGNYHPIAIQTEQGIAQSTDLPNPAESDVNPPAKRAADVPRRRSGENHILIQTNVPIDALAVEETLPPTGGWHQS